MQQPEHLPREKVTGARAELAPGDVAGPREGILPPGVVAFASPLTSANSSSSSRSRRIGRPRISRRAGTLRRPTRCPSSATMRRPASAAWTCCGGGLCRIGQKTSKSASQTSTPRLRGLRAGRLFVTHSSSGDVSYRSTTRVEEGRGRETALCDRSGRPRADGSGRSVGKLAFAGGRVGAQLRHRNDNAKRALRGAARSNAGGP